MFNGGVMKIASIVDFFTGGIWRWVALAATIAVTLLILRMHWVQEGREQILRENTIAVTRTLTKIEKVKGDVRTVYRAGETKIETRYIEIEKENKNVPSRPECNITAGWMRGHDAAAGTDRRDLGRMDDATDTGIAETAALAVVTGNYKAYTQVANDLRACRGFVSGLKAATQ